MHSSAATSERRSLRGCLHREGKRSSFTMPDNEISAEKLRGFAERRLV